MVEWRFIYSFLTVPLLSLSDDDKNERFSLKTGQMWKKLLYNKIYRFNSRTKTSVFRLKLTIENLINKSWLLISCL